MQIQFQDLIGKWWSFPCAWLCTMPWKCSHCLIGYNTMKTLMKWRYSSMHSCSWY